MAPHKHSEQYCETTMELEGLECMIKGNLILHISQLSSLKFTCNTNALQGASERLTHDTRVQITGKNCEAMKMKHRRTVDSK